MSAYVAKSPASLRPRKQLQRSEVRLQKEKPLGSPLQSDLIPLTFTFSPLIIAAATRCHCGLDGAGVFLSLLFWEPLSPLNTPTIFPNKLFFLPASSPDADWTPAAGCGFSLLVGGGSAFTEFPPKMREKNPCTPPLWSQVS